MSIARLGAGLTFALFAAAAGAQDRRPYGTAVNASTAKKIVAAVLAECQKNNWRVAAAVVDNHGFLVHFDMIDDTQTASSQIAVDKAKAAAMYRRPTRAFVDAIAKIGGPARSHRCTTRHEHAYRDLRGVFR